MFNNEQMADVHFLVGPPGETQMVPAHKVQWCPPPPPLGSPPPPAGLWPSPAPHPSSLCVSQYVLAVGSSVFGAMFYGDLAEGQSEIHIPDVEPAAFLILLK